MRPENRYDEADEVYEAKREYKSAIEDIRKDPDAKQDEFTLVTADIAYPYKMMQEAFGDLLGSVTFVEGEGQVSVRSTGNQLILMQDIMSRAHLRYLAPDGPAEKDGKAIVDSMEGMRRTPEFVAQLQERLARHAKVTNNPSFDPEGFIPCLRKEFMIVREVIATMGKGNALEG